MHRLYNIILATFHKVNFIVTDSISSSAVTPSVSHKTFRAAVIVIGNEILSGRTQDANTQWIAEKLAPRGVLLGEVRVVEDDEQAIIDAVNALRIKYNYVITTGGIGPTHDDITVESVAKAFGVSPVLNHTAKEALIAHYGSENELNAARLKMAMIPEGAVLIDNPVSGAPGFRLENVFVLAGVPRIMQAMLSHVMTLMEQGTPYLSNTVSCHLKEGDIAHDFEILQGKYPDIIMGSYPHYRGGMLGLSLVLRGANPDMLSAATDELIALIRKLGDEPRAVSLQSRPG